MASIALNYLLVSKLFPNFSYLKASFRKRKNRAYSLFSVNAILGSPLKQSCFTPSHTTPAPKPPRASAVY